MDQLRREKKLDSIIEKSEPDILKQVQDTTQRLVYLTEKLQKLEQENQKAEQLRDAQIKQLEELRSRLAKLNTIAEYYGVSIEKSKENQLEHKRLTEQLDHLNKQRRILTQAIDVQSRKQQALTAEKKRDLEQLQLRKTEILKKYNERVTELREKGLQIRDLIDRAKAEADVELFDILNKWEQANERILEKYPEGAEMDFAQLEQAAQETLNARRDQKDGSPPPMPVSQGGGKPTKIDPKNPHQNQFNEKTDMSYFLYEIRQKQE